MEARHPLARFCKGKSVRSFAHLGPHRPSPSLQGRGCLQAGGWGAAVGTFPKSFPVALGLATSARPQTLLPHGRGVVPEWNHVCCKNKVSGARRGKGRSAQPP